MNPKAEDSTQKMQTLLECLKKATDEGYKENFKITTHGLQTVSGGRAYKANEIAIANFYRFEGYSNPEDNSILYLIQAKDGKKGTLIDAYGMYADASLSAFIKNVKEIQKKTPHGTPGLLRFVKNLFSPRAKDPSLAGS
jgi:hypothetical protein